MKRKLNIGIYAHVDAGKTTLTEQLLFQAGASKKAGRVDNGNTHTDSNAIEKERGISIFTSPTSLNYKDLKINIIDTPGHTDFVSEVERSMLALDAALLIISARESVQSHTKVLYNTLKRMKVPTMIFINKIDRVGVNLSSVLEDIKEQLTQDILLLQDVSFEQNQIILTDKDLVTEDNILRLSERKPQLLEDYLNETLKKPCVDDLLKEAISDQAIFPLAFGSALKDIGVKNCLDYIYTWLPSFKERDITDPSGLCFKIVRSRNQVTRQAWIKLISGHLKLYDMIGQDKITKIQIFDQGRLVTKDVLHAGDIALLNGMHHMKVNTRFNSDEKVESLSLGTPTLKANIHVAFKTQRFLLLEALNSLMDSDPYLTYELNDHNQDILLNLFGQVQMEVIQELLKRDYNLAVSFDDPMVILKETPCQSSEAEIKMWTKGNPFNAGLKIGIDPLPLNSGIEITMMSSLNNLTKTYHNAIIDGINESLVQGLYGWELTDFKITLIDYMYNSVSSTPKDFRDLVPMVLFKALKAAQTKRLWPINHFHCVIQNHLIGKVNSEIMTMKGRLDRHDGSESFIHIHGQIPVKTSINYEQTIHEATSGHGYFLSRFSHYEEAPEDVKDRKDFFKVDPSNTEAYIMYKQNVST